jgi:2-C-methyl-D-erythritol 4-phosphate cytidylyltransferase/2-C-methyl-D-erythritol 2,4-cyclodiphosphate synthase
MKHSQKPYHKSASALIVAAGKGERFAASGTRPVPGRSDSLPKQYENLAGRPVLFYSMQAFLEHSAIDHVCVVIHPDHEAHYQKIASVFEGNKRLLPPCFGNDTRQGSVWKGLEALTGLSPHTVLIHDAARPLVTTGMIYDVINAVTPDQGAIAGTMVVDTLKTLHGDQMITGGPDRTHLFAAQTPQGFPFHSLYKAHQHAAKTGQTPVTDDAALAEQAGLPVKAVPVETPNFKITHAGDLDMAAGFILKPVNSITVTGFGYDVHGFEKGSAVILCGVEIPFHKKLKGHSDADAPMHALTDAIFGALGEGDIGTHFPPSDPQWKDASSHIFLEKAIGLIHQRGGNLIHCDITIICEEPKIGPHVQAMKQRLGEICRLRPEQIGLKATTHERIGSLGRGEGLAAMAVVTMRLVENKNWRYDV